MCMILADIVVVVVLLILSGWLYLPEGRLHIAI